MKKGRSSFATDIKTEAPMLHKPPLKSMITFGVTLFVSMSAIATGPGRSLVQQSESLGQKKGPPAIPRIDTSSLNNKKRIDLMNTDEAPSDGRNILKGSDLLKNRESLRGGDGSGGGGGLTVNGEKVTFGSTNLEFHDTKAEVLWSKLPALTFLRKEILSLPLGAAYQQKLLGALLPQSNRKYYNIDNISNSQRTEFKNAYLNTFKTQMDPNKIEVYAFTEQNNTYLLPDFYEISGVNNFGIDEQKYKLIRQAAILFHEMSWVLLPQLATGMRFQSEYNFVIEGEIKMERFLRQRTLSQIPSSYDFELYRYLSKLFKDTTLLIQGAAGEDLEKGRLGPFLNKNGEMNGGLIVGMEVINEFFSDCWERKGIDYMIIWQRHIENLAMENPEVKLFQVLYSIRDRINRGYSLLFQGTTSSGSNSQGYFCEIVEKEKLLIRAINEPFMPWLSNEDQKSGKYKVERILNQGREYLYLNR